MPKRGQAIADTSVLLGFAYIGRIDLLEAAFDRIHVVPAVLAELAAQDLPANRLLLASVKRGGVFRQVPLPVETQVLVERYASIVGRGEAEAIALGKEWNQVILTDDLAARRLAMREGALVVGSLGILDFCKRAGFIPTVRPLVEAMRQAGRYFSPALLREYLKRVEEG